MPTDRLIYLALHELSRRHAAGSAPVDSDTLTGFELRCFSQHGEDGVIAEIFARVRPTNRYFVEFGIESGREGNCVFLADVLDWRGLFLEPDDGAFALLERKYAANSRVSTVHAAITPQNVEATFKRAGVPAEPDLLSIDIDGADYWVWRALEHYRPRVVVIEYNAALPPGRALVQPADHTAPWDGTDYFGASLDALTDLARQKSYRLVHTELAGANAFFVRDDLAENAFPPVAEIPRRSQPNYFMEGGHHPHDRLGRPFENVRTGTREAVAGARRVPAPITPRTPSPDEARALAERQDIVFYQRFELARGVSTPGVSDVDALMEVAGFPAQLGGESVLDIGTTNGAIAFELERRGAGRVVAADLFDADYFGFSAIKELLGSRAEHIQAGVYELPQLFSEQFDIVVFFGGLYHVRHPLVALDAVRSLTRGTAYIESVVCDAELPAAAAVAAARFYRQDELEGDPTNWFAPSVRGLTEWCQSCGLEPDRVSAWPEGAPARALVVAHRSDGPPEYQRFSAEPPLGPG